MTEPLIAWRPGQIRQGGTCPIAHPRIEPWVLAAEVRIRPRGLAIDNSWWADYYEEFGDEALFMHDGYLNDLTPEQVEERVKAGLPVRKAEQVTLAIVMMVSKRDSFLLARSQWLDERRAFYGWVYPRQMTLFRQFAADPEREDTRYVN